MQDIPEDPMDADEAMDKLLPQGLSGDGPAATDGDGPNGADGGPPAPQDTAKDQKDMPSSFLKLTQRSMTSHRRATGTHKQKCSFPTAGKGARSVAKEGVYLVLLPVSPPQGDQEEDGQVR